jgi:predicted transcriptional regulator
MKSATHKIASYLAKLEGGKHQGRVDEFREVIRILKDQHRKSRRGSPSLLLMMAREAGHKY